MNHSDRVMRLEVRVVDYVTTVYTYSANGDLLALARMPSETDQKPR